MPVFCLAVLTNAAILPFCRSSTRPRPTDVKATAACRQDAAGNSYVVVQNIEKSDRKIELGKELNTPLIKDILNLEKVGHRDVGSLVEESLGIILLALNEIHPTDQVHVYPEDRRDMDRCNREFKSAAT